MRSRIRMLLPGCLLLCRGAWAATGPALPPAPPPPPPPPSRVVLGAIEVDAEAKTIHARGWVNMDRGLVEVLACGPRGKLHESVFVMDAGAVDLQAALLLVGLEPGRFPRGDRMMPPVGPQVDILVEWSHAGRHTVLRAEQTLIHTNRQASLPETGWVFTGSEVVDGQFKAEVDESYVTTYWDAWGILNLPLPCGGDDALLFARSEVLPPVGTPVSFRLTPRPAPARDTAPPPPRGAGDRNR